MDKKALRKTVLERRQGLSPAEQALLSLGVIKVLRESAILTKAERILAYLPFRGEVDLMSLFDDLEREGKELAFPKVVNPAQGLMEPRSVVPPWRKHVAPGAFNILEPAEGTQMASIEGLDVVLIPGVAFDRDLYRLGFGGGFYDRFLPRLGAHTVKVGVAYGFQVVGAVPRDPHDIPLDALCTEDELLLKR